MVLLYLALVRPYLGANMSSTEVKTVRRYKRNKIVIEIDEETREAEPGDH